MQASQMQTVLSRLPRPHQATPGKRAAPFHPGRDGYFPEHLTTSFHLNHYLLDFLDWNFNS